MAAKAHKREHGTTSKSKSKLKSTPKPDATSPEPDHDVAIEQGKLEELDTTRHNGRTIRIVSGSYEHNLSCMALTMSEKSEVFTPIFHFTPHTQSIRCLAWAKRYLASGGNDELIRLYDLQTRRELGTLMHHEGQVVVMEFYSTKWLLSGGTDGKICVWRTKDWEIIGELKGHKAAIEDLAIHESGKIALSVGADKKLFLWNLMTGRKASSQRLDDLPRRVAWIPGTSDYIIAFRNSINAYIGSKLAFELTSVSAIHHARFYAVNGQAHLFVAYENGTINVYKWTKDMSATTEPSHVLQGHASRVKDFAFLDEFMASASSDGKSVVWNLNDMSQVAVYTSGDRLNCIRLVSDEVEKDIKRPEPQNYSDVESEPEDKAHTKQLRKKKKARVVVEM